MPMKLLGSNRIKMRTGLMATALISVLISLPACNNAEKVITDYRTIPSDLGRDTDKARKLTGLGVALLSEAESALATGGPEAKYQKDLADAEAYFRQALVADIMYGPAHNNLGRVYYHQERYYEAAWEFQYAGQLMPNRPIPRNNLGLVFEATGQLDQAEEHYAEALQVEPDNPEFLGNLARAKVRRGEVSETLLDLLHQVVLRDTRPEWRAWAEEQQQFIAIRLSE